MQKDELILFMCTCGQAYWKPTKMWCSSEATLQEAGRNRWEPRERVLSESKAKELPTGRSAQREQRAIGRSSQREMRASGRSSYRGKRVFKKGAALYERDLSEGALRRGHNPPKRSCLTIARVERKERSGGNKKRAWRDANGQNKDLEPQGGRDERYPTPRWGKRQASGSSNEIIFCSRTTILLWIFTRFVFFYFYK